MFTPSMSLCLILLGIFSRVFSLPACVGPDDSNSKMALNVAPFPMRSVEQRGAPILEHSNLSTLWKSESKSSSVGRRSSGVKYLSRSTGTYTVASSGSVREQNGMDAINLNNLFATLQLPQPCSAGSTACINLGLAQCTSGTYTVTQCPSGSVCAALPLVGRRGTVVECTTPVARDQQIAEALVS